jgi:predicted nucleic acid-binding protein
MAELAAILGRHERVGFDTPVFIYHIEAATRFAEPAGVAMEALAAGAFAGVTSVLTLTEISVKPLQMGRPDVADECEILLANYPNLTLSAIERSTARKAAELRALHRLRPVDAFQIASRLEQVATAFLTNDEALRRVTELRVLTLGDFVATHP